LTIKATKKGQWHSAVNAAAKRKKIVHFTQDIRKKDFNEMRRMEYAERTYRKKERKKEKKRKPRQIERKKEQRNVRTVR